jgi:hypothetical protein
MGFSLSGLRLRALLEYYSQLVIGYVMCYKKKGPTKEKKKTSTGIGLLVCARSDITAAVWAFEL